ncbi:AAA family ATPase [Faecalibacterium prausnitzii]|uniref:AAA family ATPase n=1 Tax=Faecalibacterium prausnitzii TaxID=853 RepID=UPI00207A6A26|nr:AAA family ATPase [Faecalibacterium prausnitzii]
MNAKERFYSGLAKETIGKITSNTDNWTSFLRTMSRNYEFTYPEQVMIYAQRPNATFCKPYEDWNAENYRRYVKRGSTGIALFVMNRDKPYLRYVFDVADTGVRRSSPELKPWEVTPENRSYVMEAMERTFGVAADGVLEAQLEDIASALAAEYWDDYKKQFLDIVANSFLEEYDELNIEVAFKNAVANSVSYTMYCRFVESPDNYFEHEDFQKVFDFNTRQTVNALGTAVNAISTRMFQEIEKANASNITDDQKHFLQAIKNDVDCLYQKLCDLKSIGFRNLKDVAQIESTLRNKKIDLPNYANLNSDLMRSKTNVLNTTIDGVLNRIIQLRIKISRQNALIRNIISRNQKEINDFLRYAGYHYTVSIEESEGKNYRLLLHYEDHREAINAVQAHLSYGERNALALLLFMYSIKRETPDLVILDDPISSFDGNKKFAIVNMLFKEPGYLRGKTVLLLTHEFGTVVDMVHTMKRNFGAVSTAAFLSTRNGVLQEQQIHADDIKAYPAIAEKNIAESTDPLNKLIYLRRLMEFENNKNDAWQLLSNVFHVGDGTREAPMKCIGNGIEIPMTPDEVQKGTEDIKKYILDFDYQMAYQRMEDQNLLISLYDSTEANYERLQIYRLIFIGRPMNVVVQKFVNETYHVENDYMFQLDPRIYDTVPQYIVDVCNQAINELRTVQPA